MSTSVPGGAASAQWQVLLACVVTIEADYDHEPPPRAEVSVQHACLQNELCASEARSVLVAVQRVGSAPSPRQIVLTTRGSFPGQCSPAGSPPSRKCL
jgi:hypothetical protein